MICDVKELELIRIIFLELFIKILDLVNFWLNFYDLDYFNLIIFSFELNLEIKIIIRIGLQF